MVKIFISFKDKKKIYDPKKMVSRYKIRSLMKSAKKDTYVRFPDILNPKQIHFSAHDVEDMGVLLEARIERLLKLIVEINKDKDPPYRRTLLATDIQCVIKLHEFLSSS